MEQNKFVYFWDYCPKCKYKDFNEEDDPCYDCLKEPVNVDSHKPTHFKEKIDV